MASAFVRDGNVLTIQQSSRGFRLGFKIFIGMGLFGVAITALLSHVKEPTTLSCDHARQSCTLTRGTIVTELPLAPFVSTELVRKTNGSTFIALNRNRFPNYLEICGTTGDAADTGKNADALKAFFADPNHAPLDLSCTSQNVGGPDPIFLGVIFFGGVLVLMLLFRPFSTELTARFDRGAGLVKVKGSRWLSRGWSVERPLSDIVQIDASSRAGAYGARYFSLYARFRDGSAVLVWAPGAAAGKDVAVRQGELQRFVAGQAA